MVTFCRGNCAYDLYDWLLDIKDDNDRMKASRILRVMERVSLRYEKNLEEEKERYIKSCG